MKLTSLRAKLTASFAGLAAVFASFAMYFFPDTSLRYAEQLERERAQSLARTLAKAATSYLDFADDLALREIVDSIADEPEGRFSAVYNSEGKEVVTFVANPAEKVNFNGFGKTIKAGYHLVDQPDLLVIAHPIKGAMGKGGWFMIGISRDTITTMKSRIRLLSYFFALFIVVAASVLGWVLGNLIARPAVELASTSRHILGTGDLTVDFEAASRDEIGEIGSSFRELIAAQRELLQGLGAVAASVQTTSEQIAHAGGQLDEMSDAGARRIEGSQRNADATRQSLTQLSQRISELEGAMAGAQKASSNVGDIARIVAAKVAEASRIGEENQEALEEVTSRLRTAQTAADSLNGLVQAGHHTLEEMTASMGRVRVNAQHGAHAGEMVAQHADEGEEAMGRTLEDLEAIRRSSKAASAALGELVARIEEVTDIVNVIDEVAAQTNLLSLNASIIAAQAGESGRAFTVVAAEIKALSARTQDHTQRISDIVTNVKRESTAARAAMQAGLENAEKGAERGRHTAAAFTSIALAAADSRDRLRSIANDTEQQSALAQRVGTSIAELASNVATFGTEQRAVLEATGRVAEYVGEVVRTTGEVQKSSSDQLDATRMIDEAVGQARAVSRALDDAQKRQVQAQSELMSALSTLFGFARDQRAIASSLGSAINELKTRVVTLRGSVQRYRV